MLPTDGEYAFFTIEIQLYPDRGEEGWESIADSCLIAKVPAALRIKNPGKYDGKEKEPFQAFSASGKVWQTTREHGVPTRELGAQLLNLIAEYNPKHTFRLVHVLVTQRRTTLMTTSGS
jgi:hypothetical protein